MYACSVISNGCGVPVQDPKIYNTFQECTLAGHQTSIKALSNLNSDMVNKEQLFFVFNCQSTETA